MVLGVFVFVQEVVVVVFEDLEVFVFERDYCDYGRRGWRHVEWDY